MAYEKLLEYILKTGFNRSTVMIIDLTYYMNHIEANTVKYIFVKMNL